MSDLPEKDVFVNAVGCAVQAEILMIQAVKIAGLEFCLNLLQEVKENGPVPAYLEILLATLYGRATGEPDDNPKPADVAELERIWNKRPRKKNGK